jgi:hypothetical protein
LGPGPGGQHLHTRPGTKIKYWRLLAFRLVIITGKKKGQHPSAATVMRMLRDHNENAAAAA